jgi:hypothetical protein
MSLQDFFDWAHEQGYHTADQLAQRMELSRRTVYRHKHSDINDIRQFRDRAVFVFGDIVRRFFNDTAYVASDRQTEQGEESDR